jgi:uncharacterized membrane protein
MEGDESGRESAEQRGFDRILALSDGIFAFAITLLVLGLTVPTLTGVNTIANPNLLNLKLLGSLSGELSTFYSYALSFFVISVWWIAHHRVFRYINKYNTTLMWLNLFFLLFITIIPFLTELLNLYGNIQVSVIIYNLSQFIGGLALNGIWIYATKHHLIDSKALSQAQIKNIRNRGVVPSIVFLLAIVAALILPYFGIAPADAEFALFAMFPLQRTFARRSRTQG